MEHEDDGDTNYSWSTWNVTLTHGKESEEIGDKKKNIDHPDNSTEKNHFGYFEDSWRPVETNCYADFSEKEQLKLVWKTCKE